MNSKLIKSTLLAAAAAMLFSTTAWAVPTLGVASDGVYYGPCEDYILVFASGCDNTYGEDGDPHGFSVESGDTVYLWITDNGGDSPELFSSDLHLLTDGDLSNVAFTTGDGTYNINNTFTTNINGYFLDYLEGNLGDTGGDSGWYELVDAAFSGDTWVLEGTLTYDGLLTFTDHFFTFLDFDDDGDFDNGQEPFSIKTTAAVGTNVPEPGTLLLMGAGLMGAAILRRRQG